MPTCQAEDGTGLAYHVLGDGPPLVCVPGGPMCASAYLGDLGGLSERRQLIMLDLRGTGNSGVPADPASYRCDRLVSDLRALQDHLGLEKADLLAHSAGASIAMLYATSEPLRVSRLALITPSGRAVGLSIDSAARHEVTGLRRDEPWYADAVAAFDRIEAGSQSDDDWSALAPFFYGRWDAAAQAHDAARQAQANDAAAALFAADGAFDPPATRAALASVGAPVLVLAGAYDLQWPASVLADLAGLIPSAQFVIQPRAGHYPWLDDAAQFVSVVTAFLDSQP